MTDRPDQQHSDDGAVPCPCCRSPEFAEPASFEICSVCGWQDDGQDDREADLVWGGPNGALSLTQARKNYLEFGSYSEKHRRRRQPLPLPK